MIHRFLIWGFPFYLIVLEIIFRASFHQDSTAFIGPTIATAGLSSLIPLTKPKEQFIRLSSATRDALERLNIVPISEFDLGFTAFVWVVILGALLVWFWSCNASLSQPTELVCKVPKQIAIGLINYLAAVICAAWKHYI
jgi:hypothetical protein